MAVIRSGIAVVTSARASTAALSRRPTQLFFFLAVVLVVFTRFVLFVAVDCLSIALAVCTDLALLGIGVVAAVVFLLLF